MTPAAADWLYLLAALLGSIAVLAVVATIFEGDL